MNYTSFKRLLHQNNLAARKEGFKNYFYFKANEHGILSKKINFILSSKVRKFILQISKKIVPPELRGRLRTNFEGYPTSFSCCTFPKIIYSTEKIYRSISKPGDRKYFRRIKIIQHNDNTYFAKWNLRHKTAQICIPSTVVLGHNVFDPLNAAYVAHEFGHCISYLKWMDVGINPADKHKIDREKIAVLSQLRFINKGVLQFRKAMMFDVVRDYMLSIFEMEMYRDPKQNLKKVYAELVNELFFTNQKTNSKFLNDTFLTKGECYNTLFAVVYGDLLIEHFDIQTFSFCKP